MRNLKNVSKAPSFLILFLCSCCINLSLFLYGTFALHLFGNKIGITLDLII